MPQIILELSSNVIEKDFSKALAKIHQILTDGLPTTLASCKSRVILHKDFLVGNGNANNAFVHLSIGVLSGRTKETRDLVANKILKALKPYLSQSFTKLNLQITIAISELPEVFLQFP